MKNKAFNLMINVLKQQIAKLLVMDPDTMENKEAMEDYLKTGINKIKMSIPHQIMDRVVLWQQLEKLQKEEI